MRQLSCLLLASIPVMATTLVACVDENPDGEDLGYVVDGKGDGALIDAAIMVPRMSTTSHKPGVRNYTVHASNDFIEGILVIRKPAAVQ